MAAQRGSSAAVSELRRILARANEDRTLNDILAAKDEVLGRYQPMFQPATIGSLQAGDFRAFLLFRNNRHWASLHRQGPSICADMKLLRRALAILLDEERPITERLDDLVPTNRAGFVRGLGRAVLTPILLIAHPDRYGVWNNTSEAAMQSLGIWPEFARGSSFGARYERVNRILLETAEALQIDLWSLDALWWRVTARDEAGDLAEPPLEETADLDMASPSPAQLFSLERHLHDFLADNWDRTDLGKEWAIVEEDGDPSRGVEYPCDVGRIDILAHHRKKPRWLVVELKRNQSSDATVGQVLRYMGWVRKHLAAPGDDVEGLVIAHEADQTIRYALSETAGVKLNLYKVEFTLVATR